MERLTKEEFSEDLETIINLSEEIKNRGGYLNPFNIELMELLMDRSEKYVDMADKAIEEAIPDKETLQCLLLVQEYRIYELYNDVNYAINIVKKITKDEK